MQDWILLFMVKKHMMREHFKTIIDIKKSSISDGFFYGEIILPKKGSENPYFTSCGDRTRTCDLWVMSCVSDCTNLVIKYLKS